jgi:hypothetical protein
MVPDKGIIVITCHNHKHQTDSFHRRRWIAVYEILPDTGTHVYLQSTHQTGTVLHSILMDCQLSEIISRVIYNLSDKPC